MTNEELRKILDPAIRRANFRAWKREMAEKNAQIDRLGPAPMLRAPIQLQRPAPTDEITPEDFRAWERKRSLEESKRINRLVLDMVFDRR